LTTVVGGGVLLGCTFSWRELLPEVCWPTMVAARLKDPVVLGV
jgi:hypothetical protein